MYLLYLDESGTQSSARHFILAGVVVHENNIYWAKERLDKLQRKYFPSIEEPIRFHAAPLRTKDGDRVEAPFDELAAQTRSQLLSELYQIANEIHGTFFAIVIEKAYLSGSQGHYERALEEILSRFDHFIGRMFNERNERDRGLIVIADSSYRERLEWFAHQLTSKGTRWGELHAIDDIPFFTLSRNSRLLQIADLIANTVYGRYETSHAREFDRMLPKFDQDDSRVCGHSEFRSGLPKVSTENRCVQRHLHGPTSLDSRLRGNDGLEIRNVNRT